MKKNTLNPVLKYRQRRMKEFLKGFQQYLVMRRYLLDSSTYVDMRGYCYAKWVEEYEDSQVHPDIFAFLERRVPQFLKRYEEVRA